MAQFISLVVVSSWNDCSYVITALKMSTEPPVGGQGGKAPLKLMAFYYWNTHILRSPGGILHSCHALRGWCVLSSIFYLTFFEQPSVTHHTNQLASSLPVTTFSVTLLTDRQTDRQT